MSPQRLGLQYFFSGPRRGREPIGEFPGMWKTYFNLFLDDTVVVGSQQSRPVSADCSCADRRGFQYYENYLLLGRCTGEKWGTRVVLSKLGGGVADGVGDEVGKRKILD